MLYQIQDGTVSLGGEEILSHIQFEIKGTDRIGLVGRNGAGKTTLLRLIAGELCLDRDDRRQGIGITKSRDVTVGYLQQTNTFPNDQTVQEYILQLCQELDPYSMERFQYEMEFDRLMTGLGFSKEDKSKKLCEFSGGEYTKLAMIHLLLEKPDILLLDEPTNHLDVDSIQWLEDYISHYNKAVIIVSHDRFFLDQVVNVVYELEDKKLTRYVGNYTEYRINKHKAYEQQKKAYESQQDEIKRLNNLILKFRNKPSKAAFARSRKSILERMEKIDPPKENTAHIFTGTMNPKELGSKWVYEAEHLKIGYDNPLMELSFKLRRGQKIGIIGANGIGKTTFLKTIIGAIPAIEGKSQLGLHIDMGYFDQQSANITSDTTVVEHFHAKFPMMLEKDVRKILGCYLFSGGHASQRLSDLSGGEKARLLLAELLTEGHNFLVMDEPTNHMDIPAKETLESAFQTYTGTLLFVSHDRYFISEVADSLLIFAKDGVSYYPFGYKHYVERQKKQDVNGITSMISAENQALIADLKAVPKKERHETRQLTTEEAYLDWRLGLAAEPLREKESAYVQAEQLLLEHYMRKEILEMQFFYTHRGIEMTFQQLADLMGYAIALETDLSVINNVSEENILIDQYQTACMEWTEACMDYIDLYDELT